MPEWKDMTILLSSKPFGETGMLVSVLSKNNGRYKFMVSTLEDEKFIANTR